MNDWFHNLKGASQDYHAWIKESSPEELKELLEQRFQKKTLGRKQASRLTWVSWRRIAAILIIGLFIGELVHIYRPNPTERMTKIAINLPNIDTGNLHNNAYVILASGNKVQLGNDSLRSFTQNGVKISDAGNGQLTYTLLDRNAPGMIAYNTLIVPKGNEYQLVLQDGTKVWLNSESELKYPLKFNGKYRTVILKGEAYFQVKHDKKMPFRVQTENMTVMDIGTEFNIKAYSNDNQISTTLVEGSVSISNLTSSQNKVLIPGQQAKIAKDQNNISISNANIDEVLAWKKGYFIFDNEDIRSVMKVISRWYNVEVSYSLHKKVQIGGTFSKTENLSDLLRSIAVIGNIKCELKEGKIDITD